MARLRDVIAYICERYPHKWELTKGRLTKIVYLADWHNALENKEQMTNIKWHFNHYGPYVDDVFNAASASPAFRIKDGENAYGSPVEIIELKADSADTPTLSRQEKRILDEVIDEVKPMNWAQFISHVYDTYPIKSKPRYTDLDLEQIAAEVRAKRRRRDNAS